MKRLAAVLAFACLLAASSSCKKTLPIPPDFVVEGSLAEVPESVTKINAFTQGSRLKTVVIAESAIANGSFRMTFPGKNPAGLSSISESPFTRGVSVSDPRARWGFVWFSTDNQDYAVEVLLPNSDGVVKGVKFIYTDRPVRLTGNTVVRVEDTVPPSMVGWLPHRGLVKEIYPNLELRAGWNVVCCNMEISLIDISQITYSLGDAVDCRWRIMKNLSGTIIGKE